VVTALSVDEIRRQARLLVDLDRLSGAHHSQLGMGLAQRVQLIAVHDEHGVASTHLEVLDTQRTPVIVRVC
jgi:hypothetical protein